MIPEPNTLEARLARLETLSLAELRSAWCEQFGKDVPISASRKLLRRAVGHRMQELERGGLRPETRRLIEQLMASLASGGALPSRVLGRRPPAKPGTRLLRSWKGELHEVAVLTDGFLWHG